jgi:hypothetical protein
MTLLTDEENLAVQAKLNFILGAKTYDTYFQGFHCAELSGGIAVAYARSEFMAGVIGAEFSDDVAEAVTSVVGQRVTGVLVLPHRPPRR